MTVATVDAGLDFHPSAAAAPAGRAIAAQTRHELGVLLRNGEQLLLTIVIPSVILLLFTEAPLVSLPRPRLDFVVPGVLALAVMSTAFTGQAIAVGFERRYGVLRRLATTPLTRGSLLTAKTIAVLAVEMLQIALLAGVGTGLGWSPRGGAAGAAAVLGLILLGTAAFSGLGLLMAGTLPAEATLAGANLAYIVLLAVGGVAFPLSDFGSGVAQVLRLLPITAMTDGLRSVLLHGSAASLHDWLTLLVWLVIGGGASARFFRWD